MSTALLDQAVPLLATVRAEIARLTALELALTAVVPAAPRDPPPAPVVATPVAVPATDAAVLESRRMDVLPPVSVVTPETNAAIARATSGVYSAEERREMVLSLLRQRGSLRVKEIATLMLEAQNRVQEALDRLTKDGQVVRVGPGQYTAVVVQWNGAMKQPLVDRETSAFAQRPE